MKENIIGTDKVFSEHSNIRRIKNERSSGGLIVPKVPRKFLPMNLLIGPTHKLLVEQNWMLENKLKLT